MSGEKPNRWLQATPRSGVRFEVPSVAFGHCGVPEPQRWALSRLAA